MRTIPLVAMLLTAAGCIEFGSDAVTESPTGDQLLFCRSVMHIRDSVDLEPSGLKVLGSGIDDAVWFKFRTTESDVSLVFDGEFVPPDSLEGCVFMDTPPDISGWWDPGGSLTGGSVPLEGGAWMTVGYRLEQEGAVFYVFWHET